MNDTELRGGGGLFTEGRLRKQSIADIRVCTQDAAQDLALGARAARALLRPPSHTTSRRRNLYAARAEMGAQLGSSVAFGSGCGRPHHTHRAEARPLPHPARVQKRLGE